MYLLRPGPRQVDGASLAAVILTAREQVIHVPVSICERSAKSPPAAPTRVLLGQVTLRLPPPAPGPGTLSKLEELIKVVPSTLRWAWLPITWVVSCFNCSPFWAKYLPKVGKKALFQGLMLKAPIKKNRLLTYLHNDHCCPGRKEACQQ